MPPVKTAEGQAELLQRTRGLGQRYRTLLLLVDGRRSSGEVKHMAAQAGVPDTCFDELVQLGLIVSRPRSAGKPSRARGGESSLMPSALTLAPESAWRDTEGRVPRPPGGGDGPLEEARALLMRAVRNEAPVTGALTLLRLKRAATRAELEDLLDEVEQRIRKPRKLIVAAQTMRHVRHLLSLPAGTADE
jgi:hypothetical protein